MKEENGKKKKKNPAGRVAGNVESTEKIPSTRASRPQELGIKASYPRNKTIKKSVN